MPGAGYNRNATENRGAHVTQAMQMSSDQSSDSADYLTNASQIASVLKRLQEGNVLLGVNLPNDARPYISTLLAVDTAAGLLTLDQLSAADGHRRIRRGVKLAIQGQLTGVDTCFTLTVSEVSLEGGAYVYKAPLPTEILYRQRRESVRVPVRLTLNAEIRLQAQENTLTARLADLSAGGFGAVLLSGGTPAVGEHYACTMVVDGEAITMQVEIRFVAQELDQPCRFGARFRQASPRDQRYIERIVMQLQREQRRI